LPLAYRLLQYHDTSAGLQPTNIPTSLHSSYVLKLAAFLHVVDKTKLPGEKHPTQGWLPDLKLVGQPSAQPLLALLAIFSNVANLAITAPGAGFGDNGR